MECDAFSLISWAGGQAGGAVEVEKPEDVGEMLARCGISFPFGRQQPPPHVEN